MDKPDPMLSSDEFGKFFSEYRPRYIRIAYSYVHNMDEAQDLVTESFMNLWEHRHKLTWGESIKGYVFRSVINQCLMHLRERKTRLTAQDNISKSEFCKLQTSLNTLQNDELTEKLFHAEIITIYRNELAKMDEQTRAIYLASRQEDLTYQQIAEKFQLTIRQVHTQMQRALQLLRISLNDYLGVMLMILLLRFSLLCSVLP
ncbi:MAG: RNA polymerase sigma-70 factor [Alistipes sp.]